jgi:transposase
MPPRKKNTSTVSVIHEICCGLDVHKKTVTACLVWSETDGTEQYEIMEFETFTDDLLRLREWLIERECPVVAMESTGPYWTPVHNILEGFFHVILVNARHMKNVPGRKTDLSDSRWIAGLLRHGLLKAAYIPPKFQRQWRNLTRIRTKYQQTIGDFKRRVHKLFQESNIKIDSVISDLFGSSGRNLMKLLISNDSVPTLCEVEQCLRGSAKHKRREVYRSIQGFFEQHHRDLLILMLETIDNLEAQVQTLNHRIALSMRDYQEKIDMLDEVPGISDVSAPAILAEVGPTLEAFPNADALASWCGLCPGNNQSGGKRFSGKSRVRKNRLKTVMVEVAWPAVKKKGSYYRAKYYALKARLGPKKAIIAVAHKILKAIYHIIKTWRSLQRLGRDVSVGEE